MKKVILVLIIFSLTSFISLANAGNIMYRSLSVGEVLDAQDFLFDSALGTLEKIRVGTSSYGVFFYKSVDPPPYSTDVRELGFYYILEYSLNVENINLGSRMHQESDFGPGDDFCRFNGNGMASIGAGTWDIFWKYYYNPDILSFFTLKENDTSVSLTGVINEIYPDFIYDYLGKKYEFFGSFIESTQMKVDYFYTPVPEPSSCIFLLFGVLGLAAIRKKDIFHLKRS